MSRRNAGGRVLAAASAVLTAAAVLAAGMVLSSTASASPVEVHAEPVILSDGHVDAIAPRLVDGGLQIHVKDGTVNPPVFREPSDVVMWVKPDSAIEVPDDPRFFFLAPAGATVWHIPQDQIPGIVWAGWDTGGLRPDEVSTARLTMTSVDGPGQVAMFFNGSGGEPIIVFDRNAGLPSTAEFIVNTHAHLNWVFAEQGRYRMTFRVDATLVSGAVVSDTETYAIAVGDVDPSTGEPGDPPPTTTAPPMTTTTSHPTTTGSSTTSSSSAMTPPDCATVVLDDGHVDAIAPRLIDGGLQVHVKDGTVIGRPPVWREPSDVVFHVRPEAKVQVPNRPEFAFLGPPGSDVWLIPQQQVSGIVWAGWSTEELRSPEFTGSTTFRMTSVKGPGGLAVYTQQLLAPTVLFNASDGLSDERSVALGTHAHANWAFGAQGVYRVDFEVSATLGSGQTVRDTGEYTFAIGDVDPTTVPAGNGTTAGSCGVTPSPGDETEPTTLPGGGVPDSDTENLALTGSGPIVTMAIVGLVVLAGGILTVILTRRRRETATDAS